MSTTTDTPPDTAAAAAGPGTPANMEFILDIPLEVTVELGRTKLLCWPIRSSSRAARRWSSTRSSACG